MDITQTEAYEVNIRLIEVSYEEKKLSRSHYDFFKAKQPQTMEEVAEMAREIIYAVKHAEYYITLDRIEKGEEMLSKESDEKKKSEYRKLLNDLYIKLENLIPKGESA